MFGATGGTGRRVIAAAVEAGHEVTAAVRRPEAVAAAPGVRAIKADVTSAAEVAAALAGADAAISTVGPANNKKPGTLISDAVTHIIAGCAEHGVKQFVFESGLMVGDGAGLGMFSRAALAVFRSLNGKLTADKRIAEATITASPLAYVIVRPPVLDDTERGGLVSGVDARR